VDVKLQHIWGFMVKGNLVHKEINQTIWGVWTISKRPCIEKKNKEPKGVTKDNFPMCLPTK